MLNTVAKAQKNKTDDQGTKDGCFKLPYVCLRRIWF